MKILSSTQNSRSPRFWSFFAAVLTVSGLSLLTGCGMGTPTPATDTPIQAGGISGRAHGGYGPIGGATVSVYAAGYNGYGSNTLSGGADYNGTNHNLLAQTTTSTDGKGTFSFSQVVSQPGSLGSSYACPSASTEIYLVVSGGDPTGGSNPGNSAIKLLDAIGQCSSVGSGFYNVNEVSTIVSITALQQYFNASNNAIGTSTTAQGQLGLNSAFALVASMLNYASGAVNTTYTPASSVSGVTVTATPESDKVNMMANIISSCVDTTSSSSTLCQQLLGAAAPPTASFTSGSTATFNAATDTLQAAYYMATNHTSSGTLNCPGSAATSNIQCLYQLEQAIAAPFASTGAQPGDWTVAVGYNYSGTCGTTGTAEFVYRPIQIGIDASNNIWMDNSGTTATLNGNLTEINAAGVPQACVFTIPNTKGGAVIDTAGNVWVAANATKNIYRYNPGTTTLTTFSSTTVPAVPVAIFLDGSGNLFYSSSGTHSLYLLTGAPTAPTSQAFTTIGSSLTFGVPNRISGDGANVLLTSTSALLYQFYGTGYTSDNTNSAVETTNGVGVTTDNGKNVWVTHSTATMDKLVNAGAGGGTYSQASGFPLAANAAGMSSPLNPIADGAGNLWIPNNAANTGGLFSVSELGNNGTSLSPDGLTGGFQKSATYFSATRDIAVDLSGNVWVSNDGPSTNSTIMAEIVGAAVPTVTPYSVALANGTVGTKP